jgi:hypothetical protein
MLLGFFHTHTDNDGKQGLGAKRSREGVAEAENPLARVASRGI